MCEYDEQREQEYYARLEATTTGCEDCGAVIMDMCICRFDGAVGEGEL